MKPNVKYVGLDVHKDTTVVAVAEAGRIDGGMSRLPTRRRINPAVQHSTPGAFITVPGFSR